MGNCTGKNVVAGNALPDDVPQLMLSDTKRSMLSDTKRSTNPLPPMNAECRTMPRSCPPVAKFDERKQRSLAGQLCVTTNMGRLEDEYDVASARGIGDGMNGEVRSVRHRRTGHEYALKTLKQPDGQRLSHSSKQLLMSEIDAMRRLDHPNVVRLYETFADSEGIHMILELCRGEALIDALSDSHEDGYDEHEAARLVTTILNAICHCHDHDVVHRDVKLENFVFESDDDGAELKMIDFGLSFLGRPDGSKRAKGRVGTFSYMAPEVIQREPCGKPSDLWSIGVVCYMLLCGRRPFHSRDRELKSEMICHMEPDYTRPTLRHVSPEAISFLKALLAKAPADRPTAREALQHPWLVQQRAQRAATAAIRSQGDVAWCLRAFSSATRLRKVALELLAFSAPAHDVEHLRSFFNAVNVTGSGAITRNEFRDALRLAHPEFNERELRELFDCVDFSHNGEVLSYTEFLAATHGARMPPPSEEQVRAVFARLDRDGDGVITPDDLVSALGHALGRDEINQMFAQLGCTSNRLYFADLLRLMVEPAAMTVAAGLSVAKLRGSGAAMPRVPSLGEIGKSLSMSDLVLQTEARDAKDKQEQMAARPFPWLARGRSAHFVVMDSTDDASSTETESTRGFSDVGSSNESSPRIIGPDLLARTKKVQWSGSCSRQSIDGSAMITLKSEGLKSEVLHC